MRGDQYAQGGLQPDGPLTLTLVIPVFNEESAIGAFIDKINEVFERHPAIRVEMIFVNDGSTDGTLARILENQSRIKHLKIVDLSRRFGKEAALTAGLRAASGQVVVPIDADLQDPPEIVLEMIRKWHEGFEVVLAHRADRHSDSPSKRVFANLFYSIHNRIADQKVPTNVGDFRLMDRTVVDAINALPESSRFMKGVFAWVGFHTAHVDYSRPERCNGTTKFSTWRLWNLAIEGLTSFSTHPLRICTYFGLLISLISILYACFVVARVLLHGVDTPGYASLMVAVTFLGGLQLMGLGVLGEYLGKTYLEAKRRPIYVVRRIYQHEADVVVGPTDVKQ